MTIERPRNDKPDSDAETDGNHVLKPSKLHSRSFERILLIKPSAVGDVIHTIPVLAKLRARYPTARIDWLLTPAIAELLRHHPALSGVVLFARQDYAHLWRSWPAVADLGRLLGAIRRTRYDLVIDLHGQFRSALLSLVSGAPVRIGFDRPRRETQKASRPLPRAAYTHGWTGAREGAWLAYTHRILLPTLDAHAVDRYLWLGPELGLPDGPPDFHFPVPLEADQRVSALLGHHGLAGRSLAVLVPGTIWETKHWHVEGFAGVARHLSATGKAVVLAGSAKEGARCQAVVAACPDAVDFSGQTTLSDLAALIRRAAVCVTNDSGSMHLAVALGRPVVSVFGPTDPLWIGPYGRPTTVVRADVPCAPCYLRALWRCPHGHRCMNEVSAAQVIARVEETLSRSSSPAAWAA
jgi:lipopolysaccharide heptosyltransferase I